MKPTASIDLVPSVKLNVAVSRPPLLLSCHPKIDIPRMNDHTDERKRLAYIENSKPQQYGGTVEQNRNRSVLFVAGYILLHRQWYSIEVQQPFAPSKWNEDWSGPEAVVSLFLFQERWSRRMCPMR